MSDSYLSWLGGMPYVVEKIMGYVANYPWARDNNNTWQQNSKLASGKHHLFGYFYEKLFRVRREAQQPGPDNNVALAHLIKMICNSLSGKTILSTYYKYN